MFTIIYMIFGNEIFYKIESEDHVKWKETGLKYSSYNMHEISKHAAEHIHEAIHISKFFETIKYKVVLGKSDINTSWIQYRNLYDNIIYGN